MNLSLNWLKDFVDIPGKITPEELGLKLTMHTVEIDGVIKQSDKFKNVVIGKILEVSKHPNADRLQLAKVDTGKEQLDIVCGAPNIATGQLVPVALVGAVLPNGMEIKEADVRGVKSSGMLCAEDELGIGNDHSGIMILGKKAKIGQKFAEYFSSKDVVFEVDNKSISHRGDLWSHYGMAREISAFLDTKFKEYKIDKKLLSKSTDKIKINVKIEDFSLCPRYMAIAMENVKIGQSPKWMQDRLISAGMRPINNIVDITNYVMLEFGQPMHAFDASLIENDGEYNIVVREAKKKETIETLDGEKRELSEENLLITDGEKAVAIAGVMGGANSEIGEETSNIILESANFDFISIRKTSQNLGLRTESSVRFEKGLDPNLCETALVRAVELIKEICPGAKVASDLVDVHDPKNKTENKFNLNQGPIELSLSWLFSRLGENIEEKDVINIFNKLGFSTKKKGDILEVIIPTWRATRDVSLPEDLLEEISRIHGYNNLKLAMPKIEMKSVEINTERALERKIKSILIGSPALSEVYNYSFVGEEQLKRLKIDYSRHIKMINPTASHQTMLRQSLSPNLIENIKTNQFRYESVGLFEIGSIYLSIPGDINKDNESKEFLPYQEKHIGIVIAEDAKKDAFSKVKGVVELMMSSLDLPVHFIPSSLTPNWCDSQFFAEIIVAEQSIGSVSKVDSKIKNSLGLKKDVAIVEISFDKLFNLNEGKAEKKYSTLEKFPSVVRDIAFVVESKVLYNDIRQEIVHFNELIKKVELFDVFEGGKLGEGKKSLAFHVIYQADRTLTSEEVDELQKKLTKNLEQKFEAKIRDF